MAMAIGTASSPANLVADVQSETNFAAPPPPVTVVESAPSVTNAASLLVDNSMPNYFNRKRPSRQFRPASFIPSPPPYPAVHPIQPPPVPPFDSYFEFYVPGVVPRPFNYVNKPLPPPPPMGPATERFLSFPDPELIDKIVTQIDYYFSTSNLIKDTYLRQNMDDYGWVSIPLIANFNRMKRLTDNIPLIIYALGTSSTVMEVWGDRVRRRGDWKRWILPANMFPTERYSNESNDNFKEKSPINNNNVRGADARGFYDNF